jgi:hypothetical protein
MTRDHQVRAIGDGERHHGDDEGENGEEGDSHGWRLLH